MISHAFSNTFTCTPIWGCEWVDRTFLLDQTLAGLSRQSTIFDILCFLLSFRRREV
eukprot:TRINITY_DN7273_c0_g1_i1.p2 TRINITY_DN7273_c0_g1~~TRINITY_DN7273_c0_g1_i1.p2  ORF type:complete len:56 (-),score=6.73 TRINITY_DN7273_c0_g1_i1:52-219(-)